MKKKWLGILLVLCMVLSLLPFGAMAANFQDLEKDAYYLDAVEWAVGHEITQGMDTTHFGPNVTCTRGHIVTFLWRALGQPEPETEKSPFVDIQNVKDYYYKAVLWASENDITQGVDKTHFGPAAPCTRAQIVTFLYRAFGEEPEMESSPFADVQNKDDYFYAPALWALENAITMGTGNMHFSPYQPCTRAQIVSFLYRALANEYYPLLVKRVIESEGETEGYVWTYDEHGRNIRVESLDGKIWEDFTYDGEKLVSGKNQDGKIWTPTEDDDDDSGHETPSEDTFDDNGNLIKSVYHEEDGDYVTVYTYDSDGNILTSETTTPGGDIEKMIWTYNKEGVDTSFRYERTNKEDGSTEWFQYDYTYNEDGNLVKTVETDSDGSSAVETIVNTFDDNGFIKQTVTTREETMDGKTITTVVTEDYTYINGYDLIGSGMYELPHIYFD